MLPVGRSTLFTLPAPVFCVTIGVGAVWMVSQNLMKPVQHLDLGKGREGGGKERGEELHTVYFHRSPSNPQTHAAMMG